MYLYLYLYTYPNFLTSILIYSLRHWSDRCFWCAVIHLSRLRFAVLPANPGCCQRHLTNTSFQRSCKPEPHHCPHSISPCASISSICHQPSLTHAVGVLTFMGMVARERLTSRQLSIFSTLLPVRRARPCLTMCVSFNDVTSGAVHIHPRCHTRGLSLRRDGHTGVWVQSRLLRADPHRLADQHVTSEGWVPGRPPLMCCCDLRERTLWRVEQRQLLSLNASPHKYLLSILTRLVEIHTLLTPFFRECEHCCRNQPFVMSQRVCRPS